MKNIIKSTLLLIAGLFGLSVTSCNSDPNTNDAETEQSFQSCYAIVTDLSDSSQLTVNTSVVLHLYLNWTTGESEVSITGLSIGGQTYPAVRIKDMQWSLQDDGWGRIVCKTPTMEPSASGITPAISDFELKWLDRLDFAPYIGAYDPGCEFSFIIDDHYYVVGSRQPFVLAGRTQTVDTEGNTFESDKSVYVVGLDFDTRKATIAISQAQFVAEMPMLTMKFENIPFTIADGGTRFVLQIEDLIPSMNGTPQPEFPVSDLRANIIPGTGMNLTFKCDYRKKMMYNVNVDVDYTSYGAVIGA